MEQHQLPIRRMKPCETNACFGCAHFVQSGMAMGTGVGYCLNWSWRLRQFAIVREDQTCPRFRRRVKWLRPSGTSVIWSKFPELLLLFLLGFTRRHKDLKDLE